MNLGIIPARLDSKRFPKKIIHPLNGKPIVQHVYDNAQQSKYLDKLIIAIDSEETKSHLDVSSDTILTSNYPPMNELVNSRSGVLVDCNKLLTKKNKTIFRQILCNRGMYFCKCKYCWDQS